MELRLISGAVTHLTFGMAGTKQQPWQMACIGGEEAGSGNGGQALNPVASLVPVAMARTLQRLQHLRCTAAEGGASWDGSSARGAGVRPGQRSGRRCEMKAAYASRHGAMARAHYC